MRLTRALSEQPYNETISELKCVKKIKGTFDDSWIRMLQQIPGVSETKAYRLVTQHGYDTPHALLRAYQQTQNKEAMLSACFHKTICYSKLSESVYKVVTSKNANELV
eukprot:CAMPEP_0118720414 /NCGR_PEP_ID=MMETSP0800-20121206/30095_1 /TAXON_ID=210618 ORGANISM="Striatella unipunctata, Strain CCMP2910" /NCGR_SAMPLE_ID=MMETSP0800 /ASSEMBLY_ACC=CAM_ASM_000638 /LENGTH=107 /DNA_ID=CAMNT_0006628047 /DNA_START=308 /DNA_END=631 /DNA_ORIENTATION=-